MRVTIRNFRKNLFERDKSSNNIVVENMAGFSAPIDLDMPLDSYCFDDHEDPIVSQYTLEEFHIDWNNERDLDINFSY